MSHLESVDGKHLPIDPGADHFVLPVVAREDPASPDGMPVPPRHLWWDYTDTPEKFLEIGRGNIERMRRILDEAGCDVRPGERILDFGCGAGPQIRCLRGFAECGEVWGVDVSSPHVAWCATHLPECFRFAVTTAAAHLPFEDRHFDLVYCGSVFSHLGETADAWLLELGRVLRPGGRLYLTMNTKQSMASYLRRWPQVAFSRQVRAALPDEKPWERDFAMAVVGRSVWQHSVYQLGFFQRKCEQAGFRVMSVTRNAYSFQTGLLMERLETRRRDEGSRTEVVVAGKREGAGAR